MVWNLQIQRWQVLLVLSLLCLNQACAAELPQTESKPAHHSESGFRNPYIEDEGKNIFSY